MGSSAVSSDIVLTIAVLLVARYLDDSTDCRLASTVEAFHASLYMSEDRDREKLMVSVRKRDEEAVEASSPG